MTTPAQPRRRTAVLISGRGSNMRALIDAQNDATYPAEIVLVVSNRPDAAGLDVAKAAGVSTRVVDHRDFSDRDAFDLAIDQSLRDEEIDLVCLAGFMRLLTAPFVSAWQDRLINVHPSLLPAFKGLNTHERVLAAGVRITGCTVHFVRPDMDAGPIIAQAAVPVMGNDTADGLAARVLTAEHKIYPMALALVASGRTRVSGDRVLISGEPVSQTEMIAAPNVGHGTV